MGLVIAFIFAMIKTLVFIHGWASRPEIWEKQNGYFAKDYEVILPDISEAKDIKEAASLLAEGVRDRSSFVLIGWSLGWLVALEGLKNFALKPQGLVAVNSTAKFTSDGYLGIGPSDTHLAKMIRDCKQNPKKTLGDFYKTIFTPQAKNSIGNIEFKNIDYDKLIYGLYMLRDCDYREDLLEINTPALIIAGQTDKITPPEASLYMHRKIRVSELKIFDCGHISFLEQEEEFNSTVSAFIKKL